MKGDVAKLYGAWNEAVGIAERLTVVIDKDGEDHVRRAQRPGADPRPEEGAGGAG